jgi:spoIIIJ-associated protein
MTRKALLERFFKLLDIPKKSLEFIDNPEDYQVNLTVDEVSSGMLIGFRGEKINALQHIVSLMLNNDAVQYKPVNLDINQYRAKRIEQLEAMAETAATKAIESGREILLPPLSPRERRIVHLKLDQNDQVTTYSEGEGAGRRVVVRPLEV